jgi:hypothetical protein
MCSHWEKQACWGLIWDGHNIFMQMLPGQHLGLSWLTGTYGSGTELCVCHPKDATTLVLEGRRKMCSGPGSHGTTRATPWSLYEEGDHRQLFSPTSPLEPAAAPGPEVVLAAGKALAALRMPRSLPGSENPDLCLLKIKSPNSPVTLEP